MRISVGYPRRADELSILETHETRHLVERLTAVATAHDLKTMIELVSAVQIAPEVRTYLVDDKRTVVHVVSPPAAEPVPEESP